MAPYRLAVVAMIVLASAAVMGQGQSAAGGSTPREPADARASKTQTERDKPREKPDADTSEIVMRPGMLADNIETFAGRRVRLVTARVVGVFDSRAFLVDTQTPLRPAVGNRGRVVVFVEHGALRVSPDVLVASGVTVSGVARTLLGVQVTHEVPWPAALTREAVQRLEIHAAVLAASVQTADGVDLTGQP